MGTTLIITFRECLEIVLIVIPLIIYLKKIDMIKLSKYLYTGIITGALSSALIGSVIYFVVESFSVALQEIFVGFLALIISVLILYNIITINKQKSLTDPNSFSNVMKPTTLFLLAFITVFRECLEIVLFTLPTLLTSISNVALGGILGILLAVAFACVIYFTSVKININVIFILITGVLIYFGSLLFGEALVSFLPQYGDSMEKLGMLIYGIPTTIIYVKKYLKTLLKKIQ